MFQGNLLPTTWPGRVNQRRMRRLISITVLKFSNEISKQEEGVQWIDLESFKKKSEMNMKRCTAHGATPPSLLEAPTLRSM